jgi:hypothetical protein
VFEKRSFIGFELEAKYHTMAQERADWAVEAAKTLCPCPTTKE